MLLSGFSPFPLAPEDRIHEERLREALVKELYARSATSLLALASVLFVLRYLLSNALDLSPSLNWVFYGLGLVVILRLGLFVYFRLVSSPTPAGLRNFIFLSGVTLVGLGFALMNLFAWPYLDSAQIGLLLVCHAGINSVALETLSPNLWGYLAYLILNMGSLLVLCWTDPFNRWPASLHHLVLTVLGIYTGALAGMSCLSHLKLRQSFILQIRLAESALHDSLTGLRNRRFLLEFMDPESEGVIRSWSTNAPQAQSLSIMVLDLDHFKKVNDTYGHGAGDAVLRQLAQLLRDTVRRPDLVIRWGGEEFVMIARGADRGYALLLAERTRDRVAQHPFGLPDGQVIHLTCSMGYCLFPFSPRQAHLLGWEDCLELADAALYLAKTQGRDRAYGVLAGEREWEDRGETLTAAQKDLEEAVRQGRVKLVGMKPSGS
ncbi:MAG TPA: GGDEF domain-containing protein [Holophagaceae bacterium]|nr:GGDEF domain-containing protein [Holophagaceae bacterium]